LPTGSGKSVVIAGIAKVLNQPVLILQPTKEILEQNISKILSFGVAATIYSASFNQKNISKITYATIGSIVRKKELFKDFKYIIVDECFVAGTKIDGKQIEDIKVGDYVNSFNHATNKIEKKKVLSVFKRNYTGKLFLTNSLNESIVSTFNHPFFVKGIGYTQANELKKGDVLYANGNIRKKNELSSFELYNVRNRNHLSESLAGVSLQERWTDILFSQMWTKIYRSFIFRKNAHEKSNVKSGYKRKNVQNIKKDWSQTANSRRQWKGDDSASKTFIRTAWRWLVSRISYTHKTKKRIGISLPLQGGHSESNKNDCNRGRWWLPLFSFCKKKRQEKNRAITEVRVESVSVLEQGNNGGHKQGVTVHNLEVEGNNNYFANGLLVHRFI